MEVDWDDVESAGSHSSSDSDADALPLPSEKSFGCIKTSHQHSVVAIENLAALELDGEGGGDAIPGHRDRLEVDQVKQLKQSDQSVSAGSCDFGTLKDTSHLDKTDGGQRHPQQQQQHRRRSWFGFQSPRKETDSTSNASTQGCPRSESAPPPPSQPLTALEEALLDDMARSDSGGRCDEEGDNASWSKTKSRSADDQTNSQISSGNLGSAASASGPLLNVTSESRSLAACGESVSNQSIVVNHEFAHPLHVHQLNGDREVDDNQTSSSVRSAPANAGGSLKLEVSLGVGGRIDSFRSTQDPNTRRRRSAGGKDASGPKKSPRMLSLCSKDPIGSMRSVDTTDSDAVSVSTIGSSVHSGRITGQRPSLSSFSSKLSRRLSGLSNSASTRELLLASDAYYHDEDEIDFILEEEIFAAEDESHKILLAEAHELMKNVNKSVEALGADPPFRNVNDIFPRMRYIHGSLSLQCERHGVAGIRKLEKWQSSPHNSDNSLSQSTLNSIGSKEDAIPSLDDYDGVADYLMKRMAAQISHQMGVDSATAKDRRSGFLRSDSSDCRNYLSYLPNFMWYFPDLSDDSSRIRPTSLCSGTGVASGLKYIDPEMLHVFRMFGSYFVGALQENGEEEEHHNVIKVGGTDGKELLLRRRSSRWLDTIDEGDDSVDTSDGASRRSVKDTLSSSAAADGTLLSPETQLMLSQEQLDLLQGAIQDLLEAKKTAEITGTYMCSIDGTTPSRPGQVYPAADEDGDVFHELQDNDSDNGDS